MAESSALYGELKQFARRLGVLPLLDRIGLRAPLLEGLQLLISRQQRDRWRLIRQDYEACRDQLRRISRGAPAGDPSKVAWMIASMPTVWGLKLEGVIALALRLGDFYPRVVEVSPSIWTRRYHRLFGNRDFVDFQRMVANRTSAAVSRQVSDLLCSEFTVRDLLGITYRKVDVGRVALSNFLNKNKFTKLDLADPETVAALGSELADAERNVDAAEAMLAAADPAPRIGLLLEKGVSPMAEIFGVCVAHGIPVVQYSGSQRTDDYILRRFSFTNRHQHPFSLDPQSWATVQRMPWSAEHEAELMRELAESYEAGTWFKRKFLHEGKKIKSAEAVRQQLGLDPSKKTAVIFSHVLWDATFFYGEGLFEDYETWLLATVRAACANPAVNWVIKLHPDLVWKLKYEGYTGELRDVLAVRSAVGELPEHVKLVLPDTDISTYSFFGITDYCLTVRGTIGIEMACHGVPVLTAGTGRYSGLGFTIDSGSSQEYLATVAHIQTVPPMSREQIALARRFAYALFRLRAWPLRSFETMSMPIENAGHPFHHNLVPHVDSFEQLVSQADIRQFGDWVASEQVDYLKPVDSVA